MQLYNLIVPLPAVLTTKLFFPPVRQNLVSRPRLVDKVTHGLQSQLLLISAPAGYGKTTLMSEWRSGPGSQMPAAWLSLDKDDNNITRFLTYVIAALATLKKNFGEIGLTMLQSIPAPPDRAVLTSLINELGDFNKPLALILDDYHVVTAHAVNEAVTFMLDHLPSQMHMVILTRADPTLPLSRLRARNQLVEIRSADLRFNVEETIAFLNQVMGLRLSNSQVKALDDRTEGWVAGLQLAALSMLGREEVQEFVTAFTGSHHYIVDYLVDEVLNSQPEVVKEFLTRTSLLDRLTAALCNALTGRSDGQTTLEALEHTNLFIIPLDDEQRWYRYHHLFADVLRKRLHQTNPDVIPELHRRAADWLEQNHLFEEALHSYLQINDFQEAARLINEHRRPILGYRTIESVLTLMRKFPDAVIRDNPRLSVIYAWNLWLSGLRNDAEAYVLNAHQSITKQSDLSVKGASTPDFTSLFAEATAFRALIALRHGEIEAAIQFAEHAVSIAPEDEHSTLGIAYVSLYNAYREMGNMEGAIRACKLAVSANHLGHNLVLTVDAIFNLGRFLKIQGRLKDAVQVYSDGLKVAENLGQAQLPTYSLLHFGLADILLQANNLGEAEYQLELGFRLLEQHNVLLISRIGHIVMSQLKRAQGDAQGALQILQQIELDAQNSGITTYLDEAAAYKAGLQVELGCARDAESWALEIEPNIDDPIGYPKGLLVLQAAKVFMALGNLDKTEVLLSHLEKAVEAAESIGWQIEVLLLRAKLLAYKNRDDQAKALLDKAWNLALPAGYIQVFLMEGDPFRQLTADYRAQVCNRDHFSMIEPLSERELEVLRLVAGGASNSQIAKTLFIANGTVKKHISNIFGKLGVQRRTECVARARELNLL